VAAAADKASSALAITRSSVPDIPGTPDSPMQGDIRSVRAPLQDM
jgi:hypothetical protein